VKRIDQSHLKTVDQEELVPELLRTIRIPENLKQLGERLPKPNYEPLKLTSVDKANFLASIDRKKPFTKHAQSVSSIKRSGQGRRNTPSQSESESLKFDRKTFEDPVTLERETKPQASRTPDLSHGSLPRVAQSDSKANVSLNLKLRYLDKKDFAGKYQAAVIQEEYSKRNFSQESYTKKYNSVMNNLRV